MRISCKTFSNDSLSSSVSVRDNVSVRDICLLNTLTWCVENIDAVLAAMITKECNLKLCCNIQCEYRDGKEMQPYRYWEW